MRSTSSEMSFIRRSEATMGRPGNHPRGVRLEDSMISGGRHVTTRHHHNVQPRSAADQRRCGEHHNGGRRNGVTIG
jgi:hypothetical protein